VRNEIARHGFAPCSYAADTRKLTFLSTYNRDGLNTIYVRDVEAMAERVAAGRAFMLHDRPF
jgi:hypothetical protein